MGSIFMYFLGVIIRLFDLLFNIPSFALHFFLYIPGITQIWRMFVWICSLFGTTSGSAGRLMLTFVRGALTLGIVYLPFYVIRKFRLRAPRVDVHETESQTEYHGNGMKTTFSTRKHIRPRL
ncbi:MAG: hypothetical protein RLZZ324_336 [Candidatus Parcubacteria bacterium]|jgi:hypothetical protein